MRGAAQVLRVLNKCNGMRIDVMEKRKCCGIIAGLQKNKNCAIISVGTTVLRTAEYIMHLHQTVP